MPQFLILANDYTDGEALNRRLAVRGEHLERLRREKAKGTFIVGGAKLNAEGKMHGSMIVLQLDDEAAVQEWISQEPYITGKVWEHVEILPFRVAEV
ncbi:YciI family protein [Foetidibacter luteolus]|uniref:YciI family protein n=1 Tax=Foetidibacter luteolus TaxID=2608880 RepID=UPI00129BFA62|nr:YciI family protein [Foetidibacter luteolus]